MIMNFLVNTGFLISLLFVLVGIAVYYELNKTEEDVKKRRKKNVRTNNSKRKKRKILKILR